MEYKCAVCGSPVKIMQAPGGKNTASFIPNFDLFGQAPMLDRGIVCVPHLCETCGNIQFRALRRKPESEN